MNKRLNSLKSEIGINMPDFENDTKLIMSKVNNALNDDLQERKIYMRQKFLKTAFIAVMVTILATSAVFATIGISNNFLNVFFTGDTSYLDGHVQTPRQSVTDGRYVLTLEQTLVTTRQALIIYSVEALTDDAIAELNAIDERGVYAFISMDTIDFGPVDWQTVQFGGWSQGEISERRTGTKRYYAITATDIVNENEENFFIRLNKMNDPQKIIIPMTTNIETLEFVLSCSSGEDAVLQMTPLGMTLERTASVNGDMFVNMIDGLFFRMGNGEINTFSQLLIKSGVRSLEWSEEETEYLRYEMSAMFREVMSISELAGTILNGVEYDINDTSVTVPFVPDVTMLPFEMQPYYREHLWVPLRTLTERIGAEISWDSELNAAMVEYRNSTFVIERDSTIIVRDGEIFDFYNDFICEASFISDDGRLIVSSRLLDLMGIGVVSINQDENREFLPVSQWTWIIIP